MAVGHSDGVPLASWLESIDASPRDRRGTAARLLVGATPDEVQLTLSSIQDRGVSDSEAAWALSVEAWEKASELRTDDWIFATSIFTWIERTTGVTQARALRLANRLAWHTMGEPFRPARAAWLEALGAEDEPRPETMFLVALYCDRPRFLFQFKTLESVLDSLPERIAGQWPLCLALRAYDLLGRNQAARQDDAERLIRTAWSAPGSPGCEREIWDVCAQAMDSAQRPELLAEMAIGLLAQLPDSERQPVIRFRLAKAYRRAADLAGTEPARARRLREVAMEELRLSLDGLSGDNEFTRSFGEQVRLERESLVLREFVGEQEGRLLAAESRVLEIEGRIKNDSANNAIRSTEVLAIFSSAVAFAVGAAAIGSNAKSAWASVATGVALLVGLLGFASLLMVSARLTAIRRTPQVEPVDATWLSAPDLAKLRWIASCALALSVAAVIVALVVAPHIGR